MKLPIVTSKTIAGLFILLSLRSFALFCGRKYIFVRPFHEYFNEERKKRGDRTSGVFNVFKKTTMQKSETKEEFFELKEINYEHLLCRVAIERKRLRSETVQVETLRYLSKRLLSLSRNLLQVAL